MRILITGATGFLGRALLEELHAHGHADCAALCRSRASAAAAERLGVTALRGDLADLGSLRAAVTEWRPDSVAHLAAEIATQRNTRTLWATNVDGTRHLLEALDRRPPKTFVFASTAVMGRVWGRVLTPEEPPVAETAYGRSKLAGEEMVAQFGRASGVATTIVRPGHIYGPGGWYGDICRDLSRGRFLLPGDGANWWDVVHVADVARALRLALEQAPRDAVVHVADDAPIRFAEFIRRTAEALDARPPRRVSEWLARRIAGDDVITAVVRSARTSNASAREVLGWRPRYPNSRDAIPGVVAELAASA